MRFRFKICVIVLLPALASCATVNSSKYRDLNEQLRAENSLMKNRLTLLQRENAVVKDENLQGKKDIQQLNARIEKIASDMDALKEKYQKDLALRESQYQNLMQKNAILEKESSAKIQELTHLNKETELKLAAEIKRLNDAMKIQQDSFSKEREALRNESTRKEFTLSKQIEELRKSLLAREADLASSKTINSEIALKLDEALKSVDAGNKTIQQLRMEVQILKEKQQVPAPDSDVKKESPAPKK